MKLFAAPYSIKNHVKKVAVRCALFVIVGVGLTACEPQPNPLLGSWKADASCTAEYLTSISMEEERREQLIRNVNEREVSWVFTERVWQINVDGKSAATHTYNIVSAEDDYVIMTFGEKNTGAFFQVEGDVLWETTPNNKIRFCYKRNE